MSETQAPACPVSTDDPSKAVRARVTDLTLLIPSMRVIFNTTSPDTQCSKKELLIQPRCRSTDEETQLFLHRCKECPSVLLSA